MATGFVLNIPQTMLERLDEADRKIAQLEKTASKTADSVVKSFLQMKSAGIDALVTSLSSANQALAQFGNTKLPKGGLVVVTQEAAKSADKVNELTNAIAKMQTIKVSNGALERVNYEIEQAIKRLAELQAKLNFFASGEGSQSIGINTAGWENEAEGLMQRISALIEERTEIQKNAKARYIAAQQQASIDKQWYEMERQRIAAIKENARIENELAKQRIQNYVSGDRDDRKEEQIRLADQQKMYERLFGKIARLEEKLTALYNKQNKAAQESIETSKREWSERVSIWEQGFDEMERLARENAEKQSQIARENTARYIAEEQEKEKYTRERVKMLNDLALQQEAGWAAQNQEAKLSGLNVRADYNAQIKAYEQMFDEIERKRRENVKREQDAADAQAAINKKHAQQVIDDYNMQVDAARRSYEERQRMYEQLFSQRTPEELISSRGQAKTLSELQRYAKEIEGAMANLDPASQEWEKLNDIYKQTNRELKNINDSMKGIEGKHKSLINTADQVRRAFALMFSVSQMTGYFNKMIQIRGELELQQRSLQAILQNKEEADKLWNKTIALAVKSPFQIKELVTYTKQLAAYRVESSKLYDTTKMLADISAGLGVDMQRLILAYGQVKAANYLRGTELRQFSEAGINILGELSKYFTQLEGNAVSVADVFERVSRRMVTFEDVEEIFKRLTSAGGTFYRMQEIQAETLQGQISNLKDSLAIMLNDIGKANDGLIKWGVGATRSLVENWEGVATALKGVVAVLAIYKLQALAASQSTISLAIDMGVVTTAIPPQLSLWQLLQVGLKRVTASLKATGAAMKSFFASNIYLLAITALIAGIRELWQWNNRLKENVAEVANARDVEIAKINETTKAYRDLIAAKKQELAIAPNEDEQNVAKTTLAQLKALASEKGLLTFQSSIEFDQADIDDKINLLVEQLNFAENFGQEFELALQNAFDGLEFGGLIGDNLKTDLKDLDDAFANLSRGGLSNKLQQAEAELDVLYPKLTASAKRWYDELKKGKRDSETDLQYLERRIALLSRINKEMSKPAFSGDTKLSRYQLRNAMTILEAEERLLEVQAKRNEAAYEFNKIVTRTGTAFGIRDFTNAPEWQQEAVAVRVKASLDKESLSEDVKSFAEQYLAEGFKVPLMFTPPTPEQINGDDWVARAIEQLGPINKRLKAASEAAGLTTAVTIPAPKLDEQWDTYAGEIKAILDRADAIIADTSLRYTKLDKDIAKVTQTESDWLRSLFGLSTIKNTTDKKSNDIWQERANLVRKVADEAASLNEYLMDTEVAERLPKLFGEEWKKTFAALDIELSQFNWVDEDEVRAAFTRLIDATTDAAEKAKLQLAYAEWDVKVKVDLRKESLDTLKSDIDSAFEQYDVWLDLKKLGFSPDMARRLFGLDSLSLGQLRAEIEDSKGEFDALSDAGKQAYAEYLKKVDEMERKAQYDRLKEYLEYSRKAIGERAKIKLEELQHLQTIEQQFVAKEGASEAEIRLVEEQKAKAREDVRAKALSKMQAYDWQEFQQTETFINLMGDLEHASNEALTSMIEQLEGFRKQWTNMPLDEMKQIVKLINQLEEARLENVNPFSEAKLVKAKIEEDGRSKAEAEVDLIQGERQLKIINETLAVYEAINARRAEGATNEQLIAEFGQQYIDVIEGGSGAMTVMTGSLQRQKKTAQQLVNTSQDQLQNYSNLAKLYKLQEERYKTALELAHDLYNAFESIYDAVGGDNDSIVKTFADMGMTMLDAVMNTIMLRLQLKAAEAAGVEMSAAMNAAMGPIGWIVMAVEILAAGLSAAFKAHDQGLENQIESLTDHVENLQRQYERLEQAIDDAFNTSQMRSYTEQLKSTANAQISYLRAMIALEEDKKNTDEDRIKEWEDEIESLGDSLADALQNAVSKATAGILDDTFSVARDFVDAWYDSFQEVGDGISGLEDNFKDMFLNLIKQQATLQIAGDFIDRWKKYLEAYVNEEDLILTTEEAKKWAAQVKEEIPDLSLMLENLFGVFGEGVTDLTEKSSLSGLQKGISSITEETAQILEAYLNSVRFYVADSNSKLAQLVATWANPEIENPMLTNLKIIAKQTTDIHTLLESLTAPHPTESGRGLKVII